MVYLTRSVVEAVLPIYFLTSKTRPTYNIKEKCKDHSKCICINLFDLWVKVQQSRYTPWRRRGERRYISYSFLTSALD
jgi:hypothetical protein